MKFTRLLLIDDDPDDRDFFTESVRLLANDVRCTVMDEAETALEMLEKGIFRPDIIFLDLNMPKFNGENFLVAIRELESLKNIPVIIFTTSSNVQTIARMKELGAYGYLVKPTVMRDLVKKLSDVLTTVQEWLARKPQVAESLPVTSGAGSGQPGII